MGKFVAAALSSALLFCFLLAQAEATAPESEQIDLFVGGTDGYHTYRIPALLTTQKGTVLAFAEARKNSPADHGDLDLVVKRSTDGGKTWGKMQIIYDRGEQTVGNPAPVQDRNTGTIWLPFTIDNEGVYVTTSDDEGATWSAPREITNDVKPPEWDWYATGPCHAIQLSTGRLVVPCDHTEKGRFHSHVIYSDDGETWKLGGSSEKFTDESTVIELADGRLMLNMRSNYHNGMRAVALSKDGGESWGKLRFAKDLTEPVCQGSILRFTDGKNHDKNRILFSNPNSRTRDHMTIKISYDEGKSWPVAKLIYEGPSGYSDMAILPDMSIGLIYENGEKKYHEKLTFARLGLEWLTDGRDGMKNRASGVSR
ncbi:MAG: sialidase family protein [bacterium]